MAAKAGGGVGKILLFVGGGFLLLAAVGVAGVIYVGYRAKQKFEQVKSEYLPARDSESSRLVSAMKPPAGDACPILSWQDASEVLGIEWEHVSYSPARTTVAPVISLPLPQSGSASANVS
jgi:hypothetical protein